jgi:hypothetical protein
LVSLAEGFIPAEPSAKRDNPVRVATRRSRSEFEPRFDCPARERESLTLPQAALPQSPPQEG